MVENYRETGDDETRGKRYYISDLELSAEEFLKIIREHWEIENSLHWVLDVHFREDLSLSKKDNAIINFSTVRKFCYNLTKFDEKLKHLTVKRRLANYQYDIKNIENLVISLFNCPLTTDTIPRLKSENYIKILGFYPLLKKFIISSLFKWGLV